MGISTSNLKAAFSLINMVLSGETCDKGFLDDLSLIHSLYQNCLFPLYRLAKLYLDSFNCPEVVEIIRRSRILPVVDIAYYQ